jgi:hypothetical protein
MLAALATSLLLVLVGLAAFPRAQKPARVGPPQWEYKSVRVYPPAPGGHVTLDERLAREGLDGWELADCITTDGGIHTLIFKRIKQSAAE